LTGCRRLRLGVKRKLALTIPKLTADDDAFQQACHATTVLHVPLQFDNQRVNGGQKTWRWAGSGGRLKNGALR
jgi:hypothetical protein